MSRTPSSTALEPRISGDKIIIPLDGYSRRHRQHFLAILPSRLKGQVERVWEHQNELYFRAKFSNATRRELTTQRLLRTLPPLLKQLVTEYDARQAQQSAEKRKLGIPDAPQRVRKAKHKPQLPKRGAFTTKGRAYA